MKNIISIVLLVVSVVWCVSAQAQMMTPYQQQQWLYQQQMLQQQQQQNWTQQQMLYEMQNQNRYQQLPQPVPCNPLNSFMQGFQQGQRMGR